MIKYIVLIVSSAIVFAGEPYRFPWDLTALGTTPAVFPADDVDLTGVSVDGVRPLFFEGQPYKGNPTRVFAWYGAPKGGSKYPAMVVVHGGGGTAFARWVKIWNDKGYAAIAVDTAGAVPSTNKSGRVRHASAGPDGWGGFTQIDDPIEDQWSYHAVAAVVRAHSLIRSYPEVDASRIGITGISWGGYLTSMCAGVDSRFALAMPVYGCGFYQYNSTWTDPLKGMGERGEKWVSLWDASTYLSNARMPMLWLNGTVDHFFHMPSWQRSYRAAPGTSNFVLRVGMPHGHDSGWAPAELYRFADAVMKNGMPLPKVTAQNDDGKNASIRFSSVKPVVEAEFNYTADAGEWEKRRWKTSYAALDGKNGASIPLPPEARVHYFNIVDAEGCMVSSEHVEREPAGTAAADGRRVLIDENYDNRVVGRDVNGADGIDKAKGAVICISDEAAASGKQSLKFVDVPGLTRAWLPLRNIYFKGAETVTNGTVTFSFAFRNSKAYPANFTVEMRDYRTSQFKTGPKLDFMSDGSLKAGDTEVAVLPFDTWTRIALKFTFGAEKEYRLTVFGDGVKKNIMVPFSSTDFLSLGWLGFVMYNETNAVVYMDDVRLTAE
ncbi:MAG: acetylxylan esterase [Spirochaetota bacterium]